MSVTSGWVEQEEYLPEHLAGVRYYQPSEHGDEADIAELWRRRGRDER